jgi:FAD/FMN-containing dehydrogenase/short-subunit dehydrogenase
MMQEVANWGNYPVTYSTIFSPTNVEELRTIVLEKKHLIARGNGRCYGDSSLAKNIVSTLRLTKVIHFDKENGTLACESGILLKAILELIVPFGYFLPVTPGTKLITLGGAFSSNIHGKNHHVDGCFSNFVTSIKLLDEFGEIHHLMPTDELFKKTAGGMGKTGIIVSIEFQLKKIKTSYIKLRTIQAKNYAEVIQLMESNKNSTYSVAWIDCLASNKNMGRSVLLLGEHAALEDLSTKIKNPLEIHKKSKFSLFFYFPSFVINNLFVRIFNFLYYHKSIQSTSKIVHYDSYFFPLDIVNNWNRIYGKKGFLEYQMVFPKIHAEIGIKRALELLTNYNSASFLSVIKAFGDKNPTDYLNYPIEGITLGLDLKISKRVWVLLDELDELVAEYGGKTYLAKDARINKINFEKQYPNDFKSSIFQSHQMQRIRQIHQNVLLVLGANSDIAKAYVLKYVSNNPTAFVLLASRNQNQVDDFIQKNKLEERAKFVCFDAEKFESHVDFVKSIAEYKPTEIMYAAGFCPTNDACFNSIEITQKMVHVNYLGPISILNALVDDDNPFLKRIIGITSIAGVKGRKSNYMYGSTKSGFISYLFGLSQQLKERGIVVQSLAPGSVKTKMTSHLKLPFFASTPEEVANVIYSHRKKFQVYPSFIWRCIAMIVKFSPRFIVSKLA